MTQPMRSRDTIEDMFAIFGQRYAYYVTIIVGLASFSTVMMSTSVNVALPAIMGSFGIGQNVVQWVSTAFLGSMTVTILLASWLMDRFGIKWTFVGNLVLFIVGCLIAALSKSIEVLIFSRILQGLAAGYFLPLAQTLLRYVFPEKKLGLAMGLFGMMVMLTPAVGPVFGGILLDAFDWSYVFFLTIPLALLSLWLGFYTLPTRINNEKLVKAPLDWLGLLLITVFISLILLTLSQGQKLGWSENVTLLRFFIASLILISFIFWEKKTKHPLLDLNLFKFEGFIAANVVTFIFGAGMYASMLTAPLFLQQVQGLSATNSGLILLPGGLIMALLFPFTGKLADKIAPKMLIIFGLLLLALSSYLSAGVTALTSMATFSLWVIYSRVGLAFIFPSLNLSSLSTVPKHQIAQASGMLNFIRQMGGVFGVNLSIVFIEQAGSTHAQAIMNSQTYANSETWRTITELAIPLQQMGIDEQQLIPASLWYWGKELSQQALNMSFQDVFLASAVVYFLSIFSCFFLKK